MNNMGNGEKREGEKAEEGRSSCHYPFTKPGSNYTEHNIGKAVFHVNSRYTMLSPIGRGAYGLVVSATDTVTGQRVAIKRVSRLFQDLIDAKRILREIKLLRCVANERNVLGLIDLMVTPPESKDFHTVYIVTALYDTDMDRVISSPQPLSAEHIQYFLYQILIGVFTVHNMTVLHRDMKPSNLLVNSNCELAICDFGLARGYLADVDNDLTEYVVTRWYRAPELLFKSSQYDSSVDVWSIGIILAELLGRRPMFRGTCARHQIQLIVDVLGTPSEADVASYCNLQAVELMRRPPFKEAKNFQDIFPHASADAIDILKRMLSYDPQKRPTIREALDHPFVSPLVKIQLDTIKKPAIFDASFEKDYPNEMPRFLIQFHISQEIELIRKIQSTLDAEFAASMEIEREKQTDASLSLDESSLLPVSPPSSSSYLSSASSSSSSSFVST